LSPFTTTVFTPDGQITEFINVLGNSQDYFQTLPGPTFGQILSTATLTTGVFVGLDTNPQVGSAPAGPSGFRDRPGETTLGQQIPTGFNQGRMFASFNRDIRAYFIAFDVSAPSALDTIASTVPKAFDVDGDGNVVNLATELNAGCVDEAPLSATQPDLYQVFLDLNSDGSEDVMVQVVETTNANPLPAGAVLLASYNVPRVPPPNGPGGMIQIRRFLSIEALNIVLSDPQRVQFANLHLDSNCDGLADAGSAGVDSDVEFMISNVTQGFGAQDPFMDNSRPCCISLRSFVDTDADDCLGGGGEDGLSMMISFPCPDVEITKRVRCVDPPGQAFATSVSAVPGSDLEFEVTIQNFGNRDMSVSIEDVLTCAGLSPSLVTLLSCTPTAPLPASFCTDFTNAFNSGGFPLAISTPLERVNSDIRPCCVTGVSGDAPLRFTFIVRVSADATDAACTENVNCENAVAISASSIDCENPITDIDDPLTGNINEDQEEGNVADEFKSTAKDDERVIDTARETTAGADDNVADFDVLCRDIDFVKEVRVATGQSLACSDNTGFTSGILNLPVPVDPNAAIDLEYRFTVTNNGETSESVTITDTQLCADVTNDPNVAFVGACDVCDAVADGTALPDPDGPGGASGGVVQKCCRVRFNNLAAFQAFLLRDDATTACQAVLPGGGPDPDCYKNCASASATATSPPAGVCPAGPLNVTDDVTICFKPCVIEVEKFVRCVDTSATTGNPACAGGAAEGTFGTSVDALAGSCVEFCITVKNTATSNGNIDLLEFTDTVMSTPAMPVGLMLVPGSVSLRRFNTLPTDLCTSTGGTACTAPAGFNITGTPFNVEPNALCGGGVFAPGQALVLKFRAQVAADVPQPVCPTDPSAPNAMNMITVRGRRVGDTGFSCQDDNPNPVKVFYQRCNLAVEKEVKCKDAPDGDFATTTEIFPGQKVKFRVTVTNNGSAVVTMLQIRDALRCGTCTGGTVFSGNGSTACLFTVSDLAASVTMSGSPDVDVTAAFAAFSPDNVTRTFDLTSAGGLQCDQSLTITFCVDTRDDYMTIASPDFCNSVQVAVPDEGLPGLCLPTTRTGAECPKDIANATRFDATVDIKVPKLNCTKTVQAFRVSNGSSLGGPSSALTLTGLTDADFPIRLRYEFKALNSGDANLVDVQLCDMELVKDVLDCAGASILSNELCTTMGCPAPACNGVHEDADVCSPCFNLAAPAIGNPATSVTRAAEIQLTNRAAFDCLAGLDAPDNRAECYKNTGSVKGKATRAGTAGPTECPTMINVGPFECPAEVCISAKPCWIPTGITLDALGCEPATICYQVTGGPPTVIAPPPGPSPDPLSGAVLEAMKQQFTPPQDSGGLRSAAGTPTSCLVGLPSRKGSLLFYPALELKWGADGKLCNNSVITLINDASSSVKVLFYFINGDPPLPGRCVNQAETFPACTEICERAHPGWNKFDTSVMLTGNQPTYWCMSNGQPGNHVPFVNLDPGTAALDSLGNVLPVGGALPPKHTWPGRPDPDPLNPGGRMLRGYAIAWAVSSTTGCQINWNHLSGMTVNISYNCEKIWDYKCWAYQVVKTGLSLGQQVGTCGIIKLDGVEYESTPDKLLFDFYFPGIPMASGPFGSSQQPLHLDTDLTLLPPEIDLKPTNNTPVCTVANFLIWNEHESQCSNTTRCICCWDQELISVIDGCFCQNTLQAPKGKARIDGVMAQNCPFNGQSIATRFTPLIGVASKCIIKEKPPCPRVYPPLTCPQR
jgi:hypothetical protein